MLNVTLKEYKAEFESRLQIHMDEYGENSPTSFLELDLQKYSDYRHELKKILNELSVFKAADIKTKYFKSELVYKLKGISENAYKKVVSEEKNVFSRDEKNDITASQILVRLDYKSLGNLLTSVVAILNFINLKLENVHEPTVTINPHPRIFTSNQAFSIFKGLVSEFGVTKTKLADYSYVYHKMLMDGYIFDDYKQTEFVFFLLDYDINIQRIKPWNDIGNKKLRDNIFLVIKNQFKTVL